MSWSPDSSITGGAITGFTSPVFVQVDDVAPAQNAKQKTVSSITGTVGSASANAVSEPLTSSFYKPSSLKTIPAPNPTTGLRGSIPNNQYKLVIRKGGEAATGVPVVAIARLTIDVPAGMDSFDPDNVRALVSYLVGLLNEESADLADTLLTGVL